MIARPLAALIPFACILALAACKSDDRKDRRDRDGPRQEEPRAEPPAPGNGLAFRSTTGSGVREEPAGTFHIPRCGAGKLGYVTTRWSPPLTGSAMRLTYRIDASDGARIVGFEHPDKPGRMALYFQRRGDDWSTSKLDAGYRQWSTARQPLEPGDHVFEVKLVLGAWGNRTGWDAARREVANAGFTLSDTQSAGHGVCMARGTASVTVLTFEVLP